MQVIRASERQSLGRGPFQIRRLRPGLSINDGQDTGMGPLGMIDHAALGPGLLVPMHEHRNDEILSYIRSGTLWHEDTNGGRLAMTADQFAVMNAGSGISHEESIPEDGESVEMLQIFIRPREADLPPLFQSHRFATATNVGSWRLVAGPSETGAPLTVRSNVRVYDRHMLNETVSLTPETDHEQLLYVFNGRLTANDETLSAGDSIVLFSNDASVELKTDEEAEVVLFRVNRNSTYSRAGTLSG